MPTELQRWIVERSGGVGSAREAWTRAVRVAEGANWSDTSIRLFGERFENSMSLVKLCESASIDGLLSGEAVEEAIRQGMDDSGFGFGEWVRALEKLQQFLLSKARKSGLKTQLGYLHCAAEYLSVNDSGLSFSNAVEEFLGEFGYEGERA